MFAEYVSYCNGYGFKASNFAKCVVLQSVWLQIVLNNYLHFMVCMALIYLTHVLGFS